ncbi:MAG: glycosyltransferase, partial [Acidobacteriota bacterium]|nr:glycosyltransferase [Acidobacteriota bacterium]
MRVLYFAPKPCWPPTTGAMLRNYHLARETARAARVTYLSFSEDDEAAGAGDPRASSNPRASEEAEGSPARWCERVVEVARGRGYTPAKLARGALGRTPVTVLNYTTREMARELERVLAAGDFHIVQVESIHLAAYLPVVRAARTRPAVILDWHNVESEIMSRYAERAPNFLRRAYAQRTARQLAALEARALRDFDAHLTVSERDRERLFQLSPGARVHVVENGVATEHFADEEVERAQPAKDSPESGVESQESKPLAFDSRLPTPDSVAMSRTFDIGGTVGEYRIVAYVGAGGMGEVYRAVHSKLARPAAVKVLTQATQSGGFVERFFNEARIQASLQHPNVATLYDFCEVAGQPCIIMEYVDGQTVSERVAAYGAPLPLSEAAY